MPRNRTQTPARTRWIVLSLFFLALYGLNIATLGSGLDRVDALEIGAVAQLALLFLGFPVAGGALFFLASVLVTRLTGEPGGRYVFGGLFALIGLVAVVFGVFNLLEGLRSYSFLPTEGTILSSRMDVEESRSSSSTGSKSRSYTYDFEVSYRYRVEGQSFVGTAYDTSTSSRSKEEALALVERYPEGTSVPVYYDPVDPGKAVMKIGLTASWFFLLVFGAVFLLFSWGIWTIIQKARGKRVLGTITAGISFLLTVGCSAPGPETPLILTPARDATVADHFPAFEFSLANFPQDAVFSLEVAQDDRFEAPFERIEVISGFGTVRLTKPLTEGRWYARITASSPGTSAEDAIWSPVGPKRCL